MPIWLVVVLVLLMVPRTLLSDLALITENTMPYYFFALIPYAVWLGVALFYKSKKPFMDFLVLGVLYGLTLIIIHQLLWNPGSSFGYQPPQAALDFGAQFASNLQDLAARGYTIIVSLVIGIGSGIVFGLIAMASRWIRTRRKTN